MSDPLEVVRRFADAYAASDWPTTLALQTDDAVLVLPPDHHEAGIYRGHDEIRAYFRRWLGTWEGYEWTPERFVANGDRVAILAHERGQGKGSGAKTELSAGQIHTVRDGRIVRTEVFMTWEETLAELNS